MKIPIEYELNIIFKITKIQMSSKDYIQSQRWRELATHGGHYNPMKGRSKEEYQWSRN